MTNSTNEVKDTLETSPYQEKLLLFTISIMSILIAILFGKVAGSINDLHNEFQLSNITQESIVKFLTILTFFNLWITTSTTILEAHFKFKIRYRPLYAFISIFFLSAPLYIAINCVTNVSKIQVQGLEYLNLYNVGLIFVFLYFVGCLWYLYAVKLNEKLKLDSDPELMKRLKKMIFVIWASLILSVITILITFLVISNLTYLLMAMILGFIFTIIWLLFFWVYDPKVIFKLSAKE